VSQRTGLRQTRGKLDSLEIHGSLALYN